jgi:hypothetical protein
MVVVMVLCLPLDSTQATKEFRYAAVKLKAFFLHLNDDEDQSEGQRKTRSALR